MDIEIKKQDHSSSENGNVSHREDQDYPSQMNSPTKPNTPNNMPYREHGPLIDRSMTAEGFTKRAYNSGLLWPRIRHYCRGPFAEFMGTFILIMFGDGVVAQVTLSQKDGGDYQSISWGWVRPSPSPSA